MRILNTIAIKFIRELVIFLIIIFFIAFCFSVKAKAEFDIITKTKAKGFDDGPFSGFGEAVPYLYAILLSIIYYIFWYLRIIKITKEKTIEEIKEEYLDYLLFFATIFLFSPIVYFIIH
jgi:hypothetical protein